MRKLMQIVPQNHIFCLSSPMQLSQVRDIQLSQMKSRDALRHAHCVVHKDGRSVWELNWRWSSVEL